MKGVPDGNAETRVLEPASYPLFSEQGPGVSRLEGAPDVVETVLEDNEVRNISHLKLQHQFHQILR